MITFDSSPHFHPVQDRRACRLLTSVMLVAMTLVMAASSSRASADGDYDTRLEKGVELFSLMKYPEAEVFFQNLIKSEPKRKEAYFWLGKTFAKESRWNEARDAFKQSVKLAPQDTSNLREIAKSYEVEGNVELARLWHQKVLEINPNHKPTQDDLAKLEQPAPKETRPLETPAKKDDAKDVPIERVGFWQQGVAGLLGARNVWWGRLIALVLFLGTLANVPMQVPEMRRRVPQVKPGCLVVLAVPGAIFTYIVYWGIPQDVAGWALLGVYTLALAVLMRQAIAE